MAFVEVEAGAADVMKRSSRREEPIDSSGSQTYCCCAAAGAEGGGVCAGVDGVVRWTSRFGGVLSRIIVDGSGIGLNRAKC